MRLAWNSYACEYSVKILFFLFFKIKSVGGVWSVHIPLKKTMKNGIVCYANKEHEFNLGQVKVMQTNIK